ncbi:MAG TPA: SDR family oxidoreductase [Ilumatobacteraceae bacterium]|nr:SDR family oxidoreductase [Ilumatobacteraceae bacterium]
MASDGLMDTANWIPAATAGERFLVTGANGCIGAWVVKLLHDAGTEVIAFDLRDDDHRHRLINRGAVPDVDWRFGDLTVPADVMRAAADATRIVHLAALQIPFCRADPSGGAAVNVTGTVNVFEAARALEIRQVAQASSIAVFGAADDYPEAILPEDAPRRPTTLYGVYKVATEDLAGVYWADHGVRSVGLRPHTVFGPGRDQGMTSLPSVAIERAVARQPFHVDFGGRLDFQFAPDVAAAFIHAAVAPIDGAPTFNLSGTVTDVRAFLDVVAEVTGFTEITSGDASLPVVEGAMADSWRAAGGPEPTDLTEAISTSAALFAAAR